MLKKKHNAITSNRVCEAVAAGIIWTTKVPTETNLCEENQVVIKIFVNIKQIDTIHPTLVQVVVWLACQLGLFLLAP